MTAKNTQNRKRAYLLTSLGVESLAVGGLATDYCVRASFLDAIHQKSKVDLLVDATRGVNSADSELASKEMVAAGAKKTTLARFSLP
jgi:nicotinamidase/pyrazinamidase